MPSGSFNSYGRGTTAIPDLRHLWGLYFTPPILHPRLIVPKHFRKSSSGLRRGRRIGIRYASRGRSTVTRDTGLVTGDNQKLIMVRYATATDRSMGRCVTLRGPVPTRECRTRVSGRTISFRTVLAIAAWECVVNLAQRGRVLGRDAWIVLAWEPLVV